MPTFNIVVFAGDYAGPEVTAEAVKVSFLRWTGKKLSFRVRAKCQEWTANPRSVGRL